MHRRALAGKLKITSLRGLADADQRAVYTALGNIRPRPSLARIATWQADARSRLNVAAIDRSDWHTAASFAVIFAQRQVGGAWEHRVEAERTEVEPAAESRQWPGWDCGPLGRWMLGQLSSPDDQPDAEASPASPAGAGSAAPPVASAAPGHPARADLRIDSAALIDARHEHSLIKAGRVIAAPPGDLTPPVRLRFTVTGGRSGQDLRAAVWFRRPAGPGWSPHDPVIVSPTGQAEFDLSSVPPGVHDVRLLAWAADTSATLTAAVLPTLTLHEAGLDRDAEVTPRPAGKL
jgi:hypothetical protein